MQRFFSLFLSLVAVTFLFTATAGHASPVYRATLAQAPEARTAVIRSAPWTCEGDSCATNSARSRPANVCPQVARELGQVTAFTVDGEPISDEELSRCNESAR